MNGKLLASSALALVLASSLFTLPASAQTAQSTAKPTATTTAPAAAVEAKPYPMQIMRYSQDGSQAIHEIDAARVAIFNGDPKLASEMIAKAKASLAKAEQEAPSFTVKVSAVQDGKVVGTASETDKVALVPVDGQLVLAEDFVPTPEKRARIDKANDHFKNGKAKEALELRLGDISVLYTRALMPIAAANKQIEQATKLMSDHKYYEANLALKAIGDTLTVDSVAINEPVKTKS